MILLVFTAKCTEKDPLLRVCHLVVVVRPIPWVYPILNPLFFACTILELFSLINFCLKKETFLGDDITKKLLFRGSRVNVAIVRALE